MICQIHGTEMRQFSKEGRSWYSHKTTDGSWCKGEASKPATVAVQIAPGYVEQVPVAAPIPSPGPLQTATKDSVFEAKDRMSMAQTALKCAVEIHNAELSASALDSNMTVRTVEALREEYFLWIQGKANFPS